MYSLVGAGAGGGSGSSDQAPGVVCSGGAGGGWRWQAGDLMLTRAELHVLATPTGVVPVGIGAGGTAGRA